MPCRLISALLTSSLLIIGASGEGSVPDAMMDSQSELDMFSMFDPEVLEAVTSTTFEAMSTCDIDTSFMDAATKLSTGDASEMQSYYDMFQNTCDSSQEATFVKSLQTFKECSKIDFLEYMEYFPSALIGVFAECISTLDLSLLNGNPEDMQKLEISNECRDSYLGKNIFGDANRIFTLYPERTIGCFQSLSVTLPLCTYHAWPIPLVGNVLKKTACVIGQMSPVVEAMAYSELSKLDKCLPDSMTPSHCEEVRQGCREAGSMLSGVAIVIESLEGVPLSDAYLAVAKSHGLEHAVSKYGGFNKVCSDHPWSGWQDESEVTPPDYSGGIHGGGDSTGGPSHSEPSAIPNASVQAMSATGSSGGSSFGAFFGGVILGAALMGLVVAVVIKRHRGKEKYANIELSEGQLDLSLT